MNKVYNLTEPINNLLILFQLLAGPAFVAVFTVSAILLGNPPKCSDGSMVHGSETFLPFFDDIMTTERINEPFNGPTKKPTDGHEGS